MNPADPKEGELYRLVGEAGWCRHGLVTIHRHDKHGLIAADTYWGGPRFGVFEDNWFLVEKVRDRLVFILDLNTARKSHADEFEVYADADRAYIPMGGGSERHFVRADARPVFARQAERLNRLIRQEEEKAASALRWAEGLKHQRKELYEAHTVRAGETKERCRPDCSTCAEVILVTEARTEVATKPCPMLMAHNGDGSPTPGCTCKP
jgi:hypothetical protein